VVVNLAEMSIKDVVVKLLPSAINVDPGVFAINVNSQAIEAPFVVNVVVVPAVLLFLTITGFPVPEQTVVARTVKFPKISSSKANCVCDRVTMPAETVKLLQKTELPIVGEIETV
jgi:transaldolase